MKRWKRVLILGALMGGTFTAGVFAEDILQKVEAYLRPDFNIVLDGKPVALENPPLIYNDKSYLPLKELANMLGANIIWKGDNKTIYINSRINPEQPAEDKEAIYEEFTLRSPQSQMVTYLGVEYPLLTVYAEGGTSGVFYRLSDLRRMGVDTEGLKKSREKLTGVLYVSDSEAKKRWTKAPAPSRTNRDGYVIADEPNSDKIEQLKDYVKRTASYKIKDFNYNTKPIMIEKIPGMEGEDRYSYLFYQSLYGRGNGGSITQSHYFMGTIRLERTGFGDSITYTVNVIERVDLNEELEKKENKKAEEKAEQ
ncbi:copper amine oxidase N-terminal domain-containing protein [Paenibacillus sp. H1-7]|uniref:stalk domain-containing protein n=1 Tax=Paenibacillus sp. H1-7 TaxID=2282849 RepID=UPI001EF8C376|nr:stalk domain-containing protein [Paenibacillus sp. H1-7]ULL17470.1 copper amine oxidase N-terminal domain-containing protein [Paenibacillus sp. H1-7]